MPNSVSEVKLTGQAITCGRCNGHGVVDRSYHDPDECKDCGGSGLNWQYPSGAIARYYSGPLLSGPDRHRAIASTTKGTT